MVSFASEIINANNLYFVQNENAELTQQVESLQKKVEDSEEAAEKALQEYKQLQQEKENAVAKLKGGHNAPPPPLGTAAQMHVSVTAYFWYVSSCETGCCESGVCAQFSTESVCRQ